MDGTNIEWENIVSNKHGVRKESSRTNIEWEKHQVGQTMRLTSNECDIKWVKN